MSKVLRLYNTYQKCINEVRLGNGQLIIAGGDATKPIHGSMYICGPTVYSESHLGHALTYVRADLFRRVLKSLFGVRLTTVMNITDIDDKILAKANEEMESLSKCDAATTVTNDPLLHPYNKVSEKYHKSFTDDMNYIRVMPPELSIRVTSQIRLITNYIRHLEREGHAYIASNGDVYFRVSSVANYEGRVDNRKDYSDTVKHDARDFVLWKAAKASEPIWLYESPVTGQTVPGRPGWHVQCSAICSAIFGNQLDFHFGGRDLIFPHHYNEQACCCAYHNLDTSRNFHVWTQNWLHSGHLVLRDEKMSKSLGNVIGVRNFINDSSVNALRLLCIESHYRANIDFNTELLDKMKSLDHRVSAFTSFLSDQLHSISNTTQPLVSLGADNALDLEVEVERVHREILDGVCEDFDLSKGLHSILELSKMVYGVGPSNLRPRDVVILWQLVVDWSSMCGLDYGSTSGSYDARLVQLVRDFRQEVRSLAVGEMKKRKERAKDDLDDSQFLNDLLKRCDRVRSQMDDLGFVVRDEKTK